MPSLATRIRYQGLILERSEAAIAEATEELETATESLSEIQSGTLDLDAITVGGQRFVNDGGTLIAEP